MSEAVFGATAPYEAGKQTQLSCRAAQRRPRPPPRSAPEDEPSNSAPVLLGHLREATHFRHLLGWSLKRGFAGYF